MKWGKDTGVKSSSRISIECPQTCSSECVHAGAAKLVSQGVSTDVAAIASRRAAELYSLEVLDSGIQDKADNYTRFIVLSRYAGTHPVAACSICRCFLRITQDSHVHTHALLKTEHI